MDVTVQHKVLPGCSILHSITPKCYVLPGILQYTLDDERSIFKHSTAREEGISLFSQHRSQDRTQDQTPKRAWMHIRGPWQGFNGSALYGVFKYIMNKNDIGKV